jgi:DNA-binding transcriptional regulator YiaG
MKTTANFAVVFKHEVTRLVRRELRKALAPVVAAVRKQRQQVAQLKQQLAGLRKQASAPAGAAVKVDEAMLCKARFSGGLIKKLRLRHKLARTKFAALLGVSALSVKCWEDNKGRPKAENQKRLIALRQLSSRTLKKLLADKKTIDQA